MESCNLSENMIQLEKKTFENCFHNSGCPRDLIFMMQFKKLSVLLLELYNTSEQLFHMYVFFV